ncbi:HK97 family phage prohead protease [Sandarakinorhabdus sp.]|uniref:HK97 family phage prohead protease n=1 Tax=Sandarakinorhabdus sp. TaxID=1916663 RepID=UPI0028AE86D9|nr:HK97 family phage prohead protease [Sandarakinorhabdus sp.]
MATYLIDGNDALDRVEAETWADAEAAIAAKGGGEVIGELCDEIAGKSACSLTEIKFADDGVAMSFEGYGAVFNNVDRGGDKILPGAFTETLAEWKAGGRLPTMLYQHGQMGGGPVMPVGVWEQMGEDGHGLRVKGRLFDHTLGRDLYVALKGGAIGGMSIGYRAKELGRPPMGATERRQIKAASLVEVSLVNDPMNQAARFTSVKSADEIVTIRDLEHSLRDAGYSRADAVRICARFQAKADQGEPETDAAEIAALLRRNLSILQ